MGLAFMLSFIVFSGLRRRVWGILDLLVLVELGLEVNCWVG